MASDGCCGTIDKHDNWYAMITMKLSIDRDRDKNILDISRNKTLTSKEETYILQPDIAIDGCPEPIDKHNN